MAKISKEEALLAIAEQVSMMLYYFYAQDEGVPESELEELAETSSDIAEAVLMSLSLDVSSVDGDGTIHATLKTTDVLSFIDMLQETPLMGD